MRNSFAQLIDQLVHYNFHPLIEFIMVNINFSQKTEKKNKLKHNSTKISSKTYQ